MRSGEMREMHCFLQGFLHHLLQTNTKASHSSYQ